MKPLISPEDFLQLKNFILIDARTGSNIKETYRKEHLDKALFVDLDTDLAAKPIDPAKGGRHPLPAIKDFAALLGKLGITPSSHVIVYDDKAGANAAARFWWMLRAAGHEKVQVLDGGMQAAIEKGYPSNGDHVAANETKAYPFSSWQLPTVSIAEVEKFVKDPAYKVVDVRDAERYRGEKEPIDLVAGHIPGAINIPFIGNLDANGHFLSEMELEKKYSEALVDTAPENVIIHCGSGVTACHTILAMAQAGRPIPNLYVGSWSEWSRTGREIGRG